jgi:5-methylcytosine-specific restriction endonuclease McrA
MHKRTKACAITPRVRLLVENRDDGLCIFCKRRGRGEAHFISRAKGGLGVPENILTVCRECHDAMDNSTRRGVMLKIAEAYLREHYPSWDKKKLVFSKYNNSTSF